LEGDPWAGIIVGHGAAGIAPDLKMEPQVGEAMVANRSSVIGGDLQNLTQRLAGITMQTILLKMAENSLFYEQRPEN